METFFNNSTDFIKNEKGDTCLSNDGQFIKALLAIVLAALIVNLWLRVINNFFFHFLNLSQESLLWALFIALLFTGLLIIYIVFILDEETSLSVKRNLTGIAAVSAANAEANITLNESGM